MTDIDWRPRAQDLVDQIVAGDGLRDTRWRQAFVETPRHLFVPRFFHEDDMRPIDSRPATKDEWLKAVYSDDSLITQYASAPGSDIDWPTSSATRPSLMAHMLELLAVDDGHRVWEIGTGTGYNAALLCHRLGDTHVISNDIDPSLVAEASTRLAALGYRPNLIAGDGAAGIEDAAFDRIIATCAVDRIPTPWITQLNPDGAIVADLRGEIAGSLIVLHKTGPNTVKGRLVGTPGHFMWLREAADNPLRAGCQLGAVVARDDEAVRDTTTSPDLLEDPHFRMFVQLHCPNLRNAWTTVDGDRPTLHVSTHAGEWCEVSGTLQGGYQVTYNQGDDIWTAIEELAHLWGELGTPHQTRLGITVHPSGLHLLWLDEPQHIVGTLPSTNNE